LKSIAFPALPNLDNIKQESASPSAATSAPIAKKRASQTEKQPTAKKVKTEGKVLTPPSSSAQSSVSVAVKKEKHAKPTTFNENEIKKVLQRKGKMKAADLIKKFKHLIDTEEKRKVGIGLIAIHEIN